MQPTDLRYTKDHEWIRIEGDTGTIGITDYAQGELGDIVYVELPEVGTELSDGDVMGTIESVKAVSELYAPITGTITEVNALLDDQPEMLNQDAFGEGWICKISIGDSSQLEALMDSDAYAELAKK